MVFAVLADFRSYLAAPRLIAPLPLRDGWRRWAIMVVVYLAGLVAIGTLLTLWQRAWHLPAAEAFRHFAAPVLTAIVVVVAPLGEEAVFRGWLTGRPRALWLLAMVLVVAGLLGAVALHWHETVASLGLIATAIVALVGWLVLCHRAEPPRWFVRSFALWFYLSVAVFGLLHLSNYPQASWALVPMALPQVWAGLVFGYLRMRNGLAAAMTAHAVGNAVALATALLAGF